MNSLKALVPLRWKEEFHKHKPVPANIKARITNRLKGNLPVPPGELIFLVAGHTNVKKFLAGGRFDNNTIQKVLRKNNLDVHQFESVLDFGCGVGRIIRHWQGTPGPTWHGTDYNSKLIDWCKGHLKFSEFRVNTLSGGLPYEPESFDFIYAFSVFTHLREPLQVHWFDELARVLRPGGHIYLTTHGDFYFSVLSTEEREQFQARQLVVREQQESGSNVCAVFHPPGYLSDHLPINLSVVDFIPQGAEGHSHHDVYLLRKVNRSSN